MSKIEGKRALVGRQQITHAWNYAKFQNAVTALEAELAAETEAERARDKAEDDAMQAVPVPGELCREAARGEASALVTNNLIDMYCEGEEAARKKEVLARFKADRKAAEERFDVPGKVAAVAATRCGERVDELFSVQAPDLDALAYKIRRLWHVLNCWDPTDVETMGSVLSDADHPDYRESATVLMLYLDALRLAGRTDEASALYAAIQAETVAVKARLKAWRASKREGR